MDLGDGKLRGSPTSSHKKSVKPCSIPTEGARVPISQSKLISKEMEEQLSVVNLTQSSLRRSLQGKTREERQIKRAKVFEQIQHSPRFPGQTLLEQMAVSQPVAKDYQQRYLEFLNFCQGRRWDLQKMPSFDNALTEYLNDMFAEGRDISEASKAFAAALDANPAFSSKLDLPRSRRSL